MRLLLFNPDTEYALATGASFYTPPATVARLMSDMKLLPEVWAECGDIILVDDCHAVESSFRLVDWSMLADLFAQEPNVKIEPWGWNHALRRRFLDAGVPESSLPTLTYIDRLRSLAHRRTTILLNSRWNELTDESARVDLPVELSTEEDCVQFYRSNPGCWMKSPWSSSGRGVVNTGADMSECHVRPWCRGVIRRQGSVIAETPASKAADFASEWRLSAGEAVFLGLSSFSTSNRGKYISNYHAPQKTLEADFLKLCHFPLDKIIGTQKKILEEVLYGYEGLFGVDMIVENSGALRPFVEVNLRRTMGMLHLS